jgi:hypothetical protein
MVVVFTIEDKDGVAPREGMAAGFFLYLVLILDYCDSLIWSEFCVFKFWLLMVFQVDKFRVLGVLE